MSESQQKTRAIPMQVLALGLPRTGTCSVKGALLQLGYPEIYHGFDLLDRDQDIPMWNDAIEAKFSDNKPAWKRADWDKLLGHVAGVSDAPCAFFGEELMKAYPEAKVILVHRDFDRWYHSFNTNILIGMFSPVVSGVLSALEPFTGPMAISVCRKVLLGYFHASNVTEVRQNARAVYDEHHERIRALCPPENLLEYTLGSGWEPLCDFLGKPVPEVEFPRLNEEEQMALKKKEIFSGKMSMVGSALVKCGGVVATLMVGAMLYRTGGFSRLGLQLTGAASEL